MPRTFPVFHSTPCKESLTGQKTPPCSAAMRTATDFAWKTVVLTILPGSLKSDQLKSGSPEPCFFTRRAPSGPPGF